MTGVVSSVSNVDKEVICTWNEKARAIGSKLFFLEGARALVISCLVLSSLILIPALVFGVVNAVIGVPLGLSILLTIGISGLLLAVSVKGAALLEKQIETVLHDGIERQRKSWQPYVKEDILDVYGRLSFQDPAFVAKDIIEATAPEFWEYDTGVHPESEYQGANGIYMRCKKEYSFALLGFLTWKEILDLAVLCDREKKEWKNQGGNIDRAFYNELYIKCIKQYPKLVAAEAAFFAWMQEAFPYLLNARASIFFDVWSYRSALFDRIIFFSGNNQFTISRKTISFLEKLSGFGALSLSNFLFSPDSLNAITACQGERWGWDLFCKRVTEYCSKTVVYKKVFGNLESFIEFMEKGAASSFLQEQPDPFYYEKAEKNFFVSPNALWEIGSACERDAELRARIEEGLDSLDSCGYLGEHPVEEIKRLERIILGIERP
ncbi:hypothetical protein [Chlamydiifrater phoenicopteri]|uniref:hypothetical protein n=1 Tax=Chlamydiifrater phoenicopteri TaxID=2681469 RepID=UPI001BD12D2B|nr:hypothetical protein [Chlamydiifrater phoenicopteri]